MKFREDGLAGVNCWIVPHPSSQVVIGQQVRLSQDQLRTIVEVDGQVRKLERHRGRSFCGILDQRRPESATSATKPHTSEMR